SSLSETGTEQSPYQSAVRISWVRNGARSPRFTKAPQASKQPGCCRCAGQRRCSPEMARHHVILIPGFFAFGTLGELRYWTGVDHELRAAFDGFGLEVDLTEIETLPTASIRYRAAKVVEAIAEVASRDDGPIHLVGHSTGGLDARVAVTPHAALATPIEFNAFERVSSIVTI